MRKFKLPTKFNRKKKKIFQKHLPIGDATVNTDTRSVKTYMLETYLRQNRKKKYLPLISSDDKYNCNDNHYKRYESCYTCDGYYYPIVTANVNIWIFMHILYRTSKAQ
jgi:hypothetical protein